MQKENSDSKKCPTCGTCVPCEEKEPVIFKAGCKLALIMCPDGGTPDCPNQVRAKMCKDAIKCCEKKQEPEKVCPGNGLCKDCTVHKVK